MIGNRNDPNGTPAENLVSFVNSASSNVKTVLAKPGCFKRNTNHRRFLQKQLRMSVAVHGSVGAVSASVQTNNSSKGVMRHSSSKTQASFSIIKSSKYKRTLAKSPTTTIAESEEQSCHANNDVLLSSSSNKSNAEWQTIDLTVYTNPLQQGLLAARTTLDDATHSVYTQEHEFNTVVDQIVDKLLTANELPTTHDMIYTTEEDYSPTPAAGPFYTDHPISPAASYSSSTGHTDDDEALGFLSGEELMETLDISDLFAPDDTSSSRETDFSFDTDSSYQSLQTFESVLQRHML